MTSIRDKIAGLEFAAKLSDGGGLPSLQQLRDGFNALPPVGREVAIAELTGNINPLLRALGQALGGTAGVGGFPTSQSSSVQRRMMSMGGGEGARTARTVAPTYTPPARVSYSG